MSREHTIPYIREDVDSILLRLQEAETQSSSVEQVADAIGLHPEDPFLANLLGHEMHWMHLRHASSTADLFMAAPQDEFTLPEALLTVVRPNSTERMPGICIAGVLMNNGGEDQLIVTDHDQQTGFLQRYLFSDRHGNKPMLPTEYGRSYMTGGIITPAMIAQVHPTHTGVCEITAPYRMTTPGLGTDMLVRGYGTQNGSDQYTLHNGYWETTMPAHLQVKP